MPDTLADSSQDCASLNLWKGHCTYRVVASEVDGAQRIDMVVHVAGVAAALTAVGARPLGRWSLQPDPQAVAATTPCCPSGCAQSIGCQQLQRSRAKHTTLSALQMAFAHTGHYSRVVVHGVGAAVQGLDVVWREVVWRLVGSWQHADRPLARLMEHTNSPVILGSSHSRWQHSTCTPRLC